MNSITTMLGVSLLKKEKKLKTGCKLTRAERESRRVKRAHSVEIFLREILGTGLIQIEKKY